MEIIRTHPPYSVAIIIIGLSYVCEVFFPHARGWAWVVERVAILLVLAMYVSVKCFSSLVQRLGWGW